MESSSEMDYAWLVFTKSYREVNNSTQNSHLKLVAGELKEIDGKGDELPERKKKEEENEEDGAEVGGAYFGSGGAASFFSWKEEYELEASYKVLL